MFPWVFRRIGHDGPFQLGPAHHLSSCFSLTHTPLHLSTRYSLITSCLASLSHTHTHTTHSRWASWWYETIPYPSLQSALKKHELMYCILCLVQVIGVSQVIVTPGRVDLHSPPSSPPSFHSLMGDKADVCVADLSVPLPLRTKSRTNRIVRLFISTHIHTQIRWRGFFPLKFHFSHTGFSL